ncbi:MAG: hypothetical protein EAX95_08405 [Candidatus Thorarchaeota archaeon]|nr:hypothetical protein [Candidatus Thorarchaeota archaeon]
MKMLMLHVSHFWFIPEEDKSSESAKKSFGESILVWIQSERHDKEDRPGILRKMTKNIRWLCGKVGVESVILHSFAHLSDSKAKSSVANGIIEETAERLLERGFKVYIVPFGQFNEFEMHVKAPSLAKVFKSF